MSTPSNTHLYACRRLIRFINTNCGTTADWPMEICFDDPEVEAEFHAVWSDFLEATDDASPIFKQARNWEGGSADPESSTHLHD